MNPRLAAFALLLAAFAAAPAQATQGLLCRPVSGSGPSLALVLAAGGGVAGASLIEGRQTRSTFSERDGLAVRQSWIDEQRVWLDLTDLQRENDEGRLRAAFVRRGRYWHVAGTFVRAGRLYRVRCEES
ncbi:MAG TPA: hypothetical protein VEW25_05055 [Allosphingosinicella sp.]|nr:hypothetical protein [Allosphingosinicella sp.]